jgi:hypothetical protein
MVLLQKLKPANIIFFRGYIKNRLRNCELQRWKTTYLLLLMSKIM